MVIIFKSTIAQSITNVSSTRNLQLQASLEYIFDEKLNENLKYCHILHVIWLPQPVISFQVGKPPTFFSKLLFKLHFEPKITSKKGEPASFENMPFFRVIPPTPILSKNTVLGQKSILWPISEKSSLRVLLVSHFWFPG